MAEIFKFPEMVQVPVEPLDDDIERRYTAAWERFQVLAQSAYEWRDHESLEELLLVIGEIRPWVNRTAPNIVDSDGNVQTRTRLVPLRKPTFVD